MRVCLGPCGQIMLGLDNSWQEVLVRCSRPFDYLLDLLVKCSDQLFVVGGVQQFLVVAHDCRGRSLSSDHVQYFLRYLCANKSSAIERREIEYDLDLQQQDSGDVRQVNQFAVEEVGSLEHIGIFDVEVRQAHIVPIVVPTLPLGHIPFDKVVCALLLSDTKHLRRNQISDAHVVASAETQHIHQVVQYSRCGLICLDLQCCFDDSEPCSHVWLSLNHAPEVTNSRLEVVFVRLVFAQELDLSIHIADCAFDLVAVIFMLRPMLLLMCRAALLHGFATTTF